MVRWGVDDEVGALAVSYRDETQLQKQQRALETTKSRSGVGAASLALLFDERRTPPTSLGKRQSSHNSGDLSLSLESMSDSSVMPGSMRKRKHKSVGGGGAARFFCLSKFDEAAKRRLTFVIRDLGGCIDDEFVVGRTTHVIVPHPSRSIKFLQGAATGVWVLSDDYVTESAKEGKFVLEEPWEWTSKRLGRSAQPDKVTMADAPRKWRLKLGQQPGHRLLEGVHCVFLGPAEVVSSYRQLAEIMGAVTLYEGTEPDWDALSAQDVSHVFCSGYSLNAVDLAALASTPCLVPEWVVQCILQVRVVGLNEYRYQGGKRK
jgi:hypothetical protein